MYRNIKLRNVDKQTREKKGHEFHTSSLDSSYWGNGTVSNVLRLPYHLRLLYMQS